VTVMSGSAEFRNCVFESNRAMTISEASGGAAAVAMIRSGLGGAVLAYLMGSRANSSEQSLVKFVRCSFVNNSAYEGGAVAALGANAAFEGCTFANNTAKQNGLDVFVGLGGQLTISGSDITASSPTVQWERANASECLRGEYFGVELLCRRCPAASFSLVVPASTCLACPANAEVSPSWA